MDSKHQVIRSLLTDAIIDLCRREAFYVEELRIEGTVCLVSDRSSVLVAQITEQIGEGGQDGEGGTPRLNYEHEETCGKVKVGSGVVSLSVGEKSERAAEGDLELSSGTAVLSGTQGQSRSYAQGFTGDDGLGKETDKGRGAAMKLSSKHCSDDSVDSMIPSERTNGKYKCPFCPKVYGFKHNLKDHINKHTGKKPHLCKYCGLSFTFLASLCGHIKRRHFHCMPREHQCAICGNRFPNRQSLKQHYTWRHNSEKVASLAGDNKMAAQSGRRVVSPRQRKNSTPRHQDVAAINDMKINMEGERFFDESSLHRIQKNRPHKTADAESREKDNIKQPDESQEPHYADCKASKDKALDNSPVEPGPSATTSEDMDLSQLQALGLTAPKMSPDQHQPPAPAPTSLLGMPLPLLQATSMGFPMFPPPLPMFSIPTSPVTPGQNPTPSSSPSSHGNKTPKATTPELYRSSNGKFQCPYCDKAYRFKHTLKDHINTHFGKRPHSCKYCGDSFTHFASLCAHIKRRHKEHIPKDFACTICNENFMNLQSLKQHFTWRHKDMKLPPGVLPYQGGAPGGPSGSSSTSGGRRGGSARGDGRETPSKSSPSLTGPPSSVSPLHSPGHHGNQLLQSPNHLQGVQASHPHHLLSPTSPKLPSMEAFMKSGGTLGALPPFPGFPAAPLLPDHMTSVKDMKDILGGMTFDNLQATLSAGGFAPSPFSPPGFGLPGTSAPPPGSHGNESSKYQQ